MAEICGPVKRGTFRPVARISLKNVTAGPGKFEPNLDSIVKIAAISDIHGNIAALDAVLEDIRKEGVDLIVNLGDILSGPLYPCETADRLMALGLPTIRGNHERQLLEGDPERMGLSDRWTFEQLRPEHMDWIASLPATLEIGDDVLLVHGTPRDDLTYFLETVTETGCRAATYAEVRERAGEADAGLILCGHTHLQRMMRLETGQLVANPGSVGLQAYEDDRPFPHRMEMGSPRARYLVASGGGLEWEVEFRAVEYEWEGMAVRAKSNQRVDWEIALRMGVCEDAGLNSTS